MECRLTTDALLFRRLAASFTASDPYSANVIGVHLDRVLNGLRDQGAEDIWIAVIDGHRVVGVAMHTPPLNLFVSRMADAAADHLAAFLFGTGRTVPGANSEGGAVSRFSGAWSTMTGCGHRVETSTRMYRLGTLEHPCGVPGVPATGDPEWSLLIREWMAAFEAEALPHHPVAQPVAATDARLAAGELTLWTDGAPVALAGHSAPVNGVSRIGPVFVPPARRRLGYGSAVTAAAARAAIDRGADHVVLTTDLANPTSNSIYQHIGLRADHDGSEVRFSDAN